MTRLLQLATAVLVSCGIGSAHADRLPKFTDYPVKVFAGKRAKPRLNSEYLRDFEIQFRSAARDEAVNAAGRYIVVKLPCGSACVAPSLLDVRSGQVTPVFTVSGWREVNDDFDAVVSRADSRLIVFRGARDEKGAIGNHYYLIEDHGRLKHLQSVDTDGNFEATPQIE